MYRLCAVCHKCIIHCATITIGKSGYRVSSDPLYCPGNFSIKLKPFKNQILVKKKLDFLPVFSSFSTFSYKHFSLVNEKTAVLIYVIWVFLLLYNSKCPPVIWHSCIRFVYIMHKNWPICLHTTVSVLTVKNNIYYGFKHSNYFENILHINLKKHVLKTVSSKNQNRVNLLLVNKN